MRATMITTIKRNLKTRQVIGYIEDACRSGLRDTTVEMLTDTKEPPPIGSPYLTGNNRRSMTAEVSGFGKVGGAQAERVVDDGKIESAVFSTSGYGGKLEIGTDHMAARPYIRPSLDRRAPGLIPNIRRYMRAIK